MMQAYCGVWSQDGVQVQVAVRRDRCAAWGAAILYLKRMLNLVNVEALSVEEEVGYSRMIIESGSLAFEIRNL